MTVEGVDYSFDRPTSPNALYNAGKRFACRYLAIPPNGKILTRTEADGLAKAGLWLVANWEQSGTGATSPETAAAQALSQAHALGIPKGRPIYASADFDVQSPDYDRAKDWITRFHTALKGEYDGRAMYGSYDLLKAGLDQGWLKWAWQTLAWSEGRRDTRAQLYQHAVNVTVAGAACDLDTAYATDYGQWMPGILPDGADQGDPMPTAIHVAFDAGQIVTDEAYLYIDKDNSVSVASGPGYVSGDLFFAFEVVDTGDADDQPVAQIKPIVSEVKNGKLTSSNSLGVQELIATGGTTSGHVPVGGIHLGKDKRLRFRVAAQGDLKIKVTNAQFRGLYWND